MNKNEKFAQDIALDQRGIIGGKMSFPTMVYYRDIVEYEKKNDEWSKDILEMTKEKGVVKSNIFGWQSEFVHHTGLKWEVQSFADDLHEALKIDEDYPAEIDAMWFNVNTKGSYNKTHTHPGAHLSFVYYVQCPEKCGMLSFEDPREQAMAVQLPFKKNPEKGWQGERPEEYGQEVFWLPIPGRMIMFPAWLRHSVEPNQSDEYRISVSGNITFRKN